jgi:hypothetical protein
VPHVRLLLRSRLVLPPAAACCILVAAAGTAAVRAADGQTAAAPPGVGMAAALPDQSTTAAAAVPPGFRSPAPEAPCYLLLRAGRAVLDTPALLDAPLRAAAAAGLRVVVRLGDDTLPAGAEADPLWAARIGALARHAAPAPVAWQILEEAPRRLTPHRYAYLLKLAAVAVRSARPGTRVVSPPLLAGDAAWAAGLLGGGDAAPYLDVLAARDPDALGAVLDVRDAAHPRAAVWVTDAPVDPLALRPSAARAWLESYSRGAEVVLFAAAPAGPAVDLGAHLTWLRGLLPPGIAPASAAALPLAIRGRDATGEAMLRTLVFYDPAGRLGIAAYRLAEGAPGPAAGGAEPGPEAPPAAAALAVRSPLASLDIVDPAAMTDMRLGGPVGPGSTATVAARGDYLVLRFRIAAAAIPVQESERVAAAAELSAAEIIARQREFHAAQDARLRHYRADATVAIHYRIASLAQTVDVTTENRLYVRGTQQDYEQTALYVDGALWRGRTPPYLPFIQPDKVSEVPLAIVLDEGYRYALVGRERWDGRDCYVLEFEPATAERSLYRGRVWIDARTFARVRMDAVQEGLKEPLRANQIDYRFGPVAGPDGDYWLPVEVIGQMVFEVLGYNLVVERRVLHAGFRVNDEGFEAALQAAYASTRPLYRETEDGYYRLDVVDGVPRTRDASTLRNAFILGGVSIGDGGDVGSAFAGVNWFDFDFRGSGTQFNLAWAGPFADISWTDPAVTAAGPGRRPLSFTAQGSFNALGQRDKIARLDDTPRAEYVNVIRETVRGALAVPMGHHFKWTVEARATYLDFRARDETDDAFVLPPSTLERGGLLRLEFNR